MWFKVSVIGTQIVMLLTLMTFIVLMDRIGIDGLIIGVVLVLGVILIITYGHAIRRPYEVTIVLSINIIVLIMIIVQLLEFK